MSDPEKKYSTFVLPSPLVYSYIELSLIEYKALILLYKVQSENFSSKKLYIKKEKLLKSLSPANTNEKYYLQKILSLKDREIYINALSIGQKNKKIKKQHVILFDYIYTQDEYIKFKFNSIITYMFLNARTTREEKKIYFATIDVQKILKLNSIYSIFIYMFLQDYKNSKYMPVLPIFDIFGKKYAGNNIYRLLQRIQKDLENIDIYITYSIKKGKIRIQTTQEKKQRQKENNSTVIPFPLSPPFGTTYTGTAKTGVDI